MSKVKKNTDKVLVAIKAAMESRMPTMIVGAPGTAKTATIRSIAEEMGYELLTVIGSQMDPTDIVGLPQGQEVGKAENGEPIYATVNLSPWWQARILLKKKVILFLDEFSNTSGAVRASMLTLLQNREFPNGQVMPDETIVIGAMNPADQAADGYDLDLPTANRLFFVPWKPTIDSWLEGMISNWGAEVSPSEQKWRGLIVRFIRENPTYIHQEPKDSETTEVYGVNANDSSEMEVFRNAWPSRRSWDNLSRVLANAPDEVFIQDTLAQGIVGYSASAAFRDWLRSNESIDPDEVLRNPKKVDWASLDVNDTNLVFRAVIEKINDKTALKAIDMIEAVLDANQGHLIGAFFQDILARGVDTKHVSSATATKVRERVKGLLPRLTEFLKNT